MPIKMEMKNGKIFKWTWCGLYIYINKSDRKILIFCIFCSRNENIIKYLSKNGININWNIKYNIALTVLLIIIFVSIIIVPILC